MCQNLDKLIYQIYNFHEIHIFKNLMRLYRIEHWYSNRIFRGLKYRNQWQRVIISSLGVKSKKNGAPNLTADVDTGPRTLNGIK